MLLAEIVNSCTNEKVAEAAIASMGGVFYEDIARAAARREMSVGALVAALVLRFAWRADEFELRALASATRGAPAPVLAGLEYILECMIDEDDDAAHRRLPVVARQRGQIAAAA
jgi:hypothetical protein